MDLFKQLGPLSFREFFVKNVTCYVECCLDLRKWNLHVIVLTPFQATMPAMGLVRCQLILLCNLAD